MNKTLIITGGSKGIGRSIAMKFAENNFDIYTCSRNKDELNSIFQNTIFSGIIHFAALKSVSDRKSVV